MNLDQIDRRALQRLMSGGRMTWAELAGSLGLSAVAVAQRVRRLEEAGVIEGYAARVDPAQVGLGLTAFLGVGLGSHVTRPRFLARVVKRAEIQECHHVTGEFDYLLKVRCVGTRELEGLIDELKAEAGVSSSRTLVVLSTAKETAVLPLPGLVRPPGRSAREARRAR